MPNSLIYMGISYNLSNLHNYSPLDTRMNIKKLIASIAIALGASMSVGMAQAQTNYNFNATLSNGWVMSAVYTADTSQATSQLDQGVTYTSSPFVSVSNFMLNGASFNILTPAYPDNSSRNFGSVTTNSANSEVNGVSKFLLRNTNPSTLVNSPWSETDYVIVYGQSPTANALTTNGSSYFWPHQPTFNSSVTFNIGGAVGPAVQFTSASWTPEASSGIAPEMNASFIPQVALMLACLFFLLGRKKEVVEPMLAA